MAEGPNFYISWSDLVTLLLVFFVYLFSISSIDIIKFLEIKRSIWGRYFEYKPDPRNIKEVNKNSEFKLNEQRKAALSGPIERFTVLKDLKKTREHIETSTSIKIETLKKIKQQQEQIMQMKIDIEDLIEKEKLKSVFTVEYTDMQLELSFGDAVFFDTGSASIKMSGESINFILANLFKKTNSQILIEGHTDNIPIHNKQYPSNWELSTARSAAVVRSLVNKGLNPSRFAALGFGEFQPVVDNNSPENRAKNRRVKIILKPKDIKPNTTEIKNKTIKVKETK
eukprot:COSAG01_NODE_3_length_63519_cov_1591.007663_40_plen_283_part_00